jgi:tRNA(fMet)-specific endonuclease VapC
MEKKIILLDTSILIEYYRKKNKSNSVLYQLSQRFESFAVSVITQYEIYVGASPAQIEFWNQFFFSLTVLSFDTETSKQAVAINAELKRVRKQIDIPDLFIAATALSHNLSLSTLNNKHFARVDKLTLIDQLT